MDGKRSQMPEPPKSRLDAEIDEILARTDTEPGKVVKFTTRAQRERELRWWRFRERIRTFRLTTLHFLVGCLVLAILAVIVQGPSPFLAKFLALASVGCLVMVFLRAFKTPNNPTVKRWRGRDITLGGPDSRDPRDRFRRPKP